MNALLNLLTIGIISTLIYHYVKRRKSNPGGDWTSALRHLDFKPGPLTEVHAEPPTEDPHTSASIVCPHCPETFQHYPAYIRHIDVRHGTP